MNKSKPKRKKTVKAWATVYRSKKLWGVNFSKEDAKRDIEDFYGGAGDDLVIVPCEIKYPV